MDDSDVKDNLEPEMYEEYIKSVMSMTCQHPFLGKSNDTMDFVGPAFRDFSLAILLGIKDKYSYVSDYKSWHKGAFIPSQLLFDFIVYLMINAILQKHFDMYMMLFWQRRHQI